ncbi:P-loop NTPase family protein [Haloplasma contractile]|uniref:AAA domain protein n=1 Tax=Haloplasma contractile SSD-17B TaxID=1033810 RepID=U2FQ62_9MOLU|nr:hypothetical protein [Haloplasma contractile]ERJ13184.1 AAA domain protein [Haloplasma contractile SSD-17B]
MNNKLILVEGIPGSGKTTISKKIKACLERQGQKVKLFNEGDFHPADLAWIAYLTADEYNELLKDYPKYEDIIRKNSCVEDDYVLVTYTKLGLGLKESKLIKYLESKQVYNARVPLNTFMEIHLKRWKRFATHVDKNIVYIFECAYLQNHVNELLAYHNKDELYIRDYLIKLILMVNTLNPKLIYLKQPDVSETIRRVAKERTSTNKDKWDDWIDLVVGYIESCPYGEKHNLKGFEGVVAYFEKRKKIELSTVKQLQIEHVVIDNQSYNWDEVTSKVLKQFI